MSRISASILLIIFLSISVKTTVVKVDGCVIDTIGGGCPDNKACLETCRPCFRGVGNIEASCAAPGGGILWWRCRCAFYNGAPCPPQGPPGCPKPPALVSRNLNRNHNRNRNRNNYGFPPIHPPAA